MNVIINHNATDHIYIVCGKTDLRKGIDRLAEIIFCQTHRQKPIPSDTHYIRIESILSVHLHHGRLRKIPTSTKSCRAENSAHKKSRPLSLLFLQH